ncbi:MAG: hypothetical protein RR436_04465 [Clostridia bacterium]
MKKQVKNILFLVVGSLVVIGTFSVLLLLNFFKLNVDALSGGFLIFAEIGLVFTLYKMSRAKVSRSIVQKSGLISLTSLYALIITILLVVFKILNSSFNTALAIYIGVTCFAVVIGISIFLFSNKVQKSNENTTQERRLMQICEKRIFDLTTESKNARYQNQLNEIYESLKYSDKVGVSSVDEKIVGAILNLETNITSEKAVDIFDNIKALLKQRSMELSENKRGEF